MQKDFYRSFSPVKTEVRARVKEKREDVFLRYNSKTGTVKNDSHFVTVFQLPNGEEVISYSREHFAHFVKGKSYDIKISFQNLSNGKTLLFV